MANKEITVWGIHAGRSGDADALFLKKNVIALGWHNIGDLSHLSIVARNAPGIFTQSAPPAFTHTAPLCGGSTDWDYGWFFIFRRGASC